MAWVDPEKSTSKRPIHPAVHLRTDRLTLCEWALLRCHRPSPEEQHRNSVHPKFSMPPHSTFILEIPQLNRTIFIDRACCGNHVAYYPPQINRGGWMLPDLGEFSNSSSPTRSNDNPKRRSGYCLYNGYRNYVLTQTSTAGLLRTEGVPLHQPHWKAQAIAPYRVHGRA